MANLLDHRFSFTLLLYRDIVEFIHESRSQMPMSCHFKCRHRQEVRYATCTGLESHRCPEASYLLYYLN